MPEEKVFDLMAAANELTAEESGTTEAPTETANVEGQPATDPSQTTEETDPREILEKLEAAPANEGLAQALEQINQLGAIHKGMPIKIDGPEQLKEIIQKGFDYTQKTMAFAEEARVKSEEYAQREAKFKENEEAFAQKEREIADVVNDNNIITNLLTKWQQSDPDLFQFIQNAYLQEVNQFKMNQPIVAKYEGQIQELRNEFTKLTKGKETEKLGEIRNGWEKELAEVQGKLAGKLAKIGVKVDWDKAVKETWAADATGKMSVEDAFYAKYGKEVAAANQSYQKLLATKNKAQASKLQRTGVGYSSSADKGDQVIMPGDYESLLRAN